MSKSAVPALLIGGTSFPPLRLAEKRSVCELTTGTATRLATAASIAKNRIFLFFIITFLPFEVRNATFVLSRQPVVVSVSEKQRGCYFPRRFITISNARAGTANVRRGREPHNDRYPNTPLRERSASSGGRDLSEWAESLKQLSKGRVYEETSGNCSGDNWIGVCCGAACSRSADRISFQTFGT